MAGNAQNQIVQVIANLNPCHTAGCCHLASSQSIAQLFWKSHNDSCNCFTYCCKLTNIGSTNRNTSAWNKTSQSVTGAGN